MSLAATQRNSKYTENTHILKTNLWSKHSRSSKQ